MIPYQRDNNWDAVVVPNIFLMTQMIKHNLLI